MKNKTTPTPTFWSYLFKLTNAFGSGLASLGFDLAPHDAEKLVANAQKKTGLDDYPEGRFGEQTAAGQSEFREGFPPLLWCQKRSYLQDT